MRPQPTANSPGWISDHDQSYDAKNQLIRVKDMQKWSEKNGIMDDFSTWELDLVTWEWSCVELKNWTQYVFSRKDNEYSNLWEIRNRYSSQKLGIDTDMIINDGAVLAKR